MDGLEELGSRGLEGQCDCRSSVRDVKWFVDGSQFG